MKTEITLELDDNLAQMLWHTGCHGFYHAQEDRFSLIDGNLEDPDFEKDENTSMTFHSSFLEGLIYKTYLEKKGIKTILLVEDDWESSESTYVVLSNENHEEKFGYGKYRKE